MSAPYASRPIGLLYGLAAIGEYVGVTAQQAEWLIREDNMPAFNVGRVVCARRLRLNQHFWRLETAGLGSPAAEPGSSGAPTVIRGIRDIARHLRMEIKVAQHLHNQRLLPSFRDDQGAPIATVAALDDYLALKAGGSNA